MSALVIGLGNPWRRDDGAGLEVAERLGGIAHEGDAAALLHLWAGAGDVVVVDAARSGARPGTVHRLDPDARPLPARTLRSSTHQFGAAEAIELARALGLLPPCLCVLAIEGASFTLGRGLTPAVRRAVESVTAKGVAR